MTFEDPNAVSAVIGREHFLDGKQIDPKRAIPREEHIRNTRYFVGGLAATTTAESMKEFFSQYGKVVDATVMVDRENGRSKGFGFVTFEDATNTDSLVGKTGLVLDEKQIEVKMAQPRSQRDLTRAMGGQPNTGILSDGTGQIRNNIPMNNIPFTPQQSNPMAMMLQRGMNQVPMMGGGMPMMGMNPMAMMGMNMGMGMGGMNGMMGGMGGMMGGGMGGMAGMGGMGGMTGMGNMGNMTGMVNMGNMQPMRMGMGPIGGGMGVGGAMTGMGMNRMGMNAGGPGPARVSSRGQHSYHPYAR